MSYLVLARKYRPPGFEDIVGQEHIVQTLENAIKLERVHHAFLFTGPRGVGKTTTARVLARTLGCDDLDVVEVDAASNSGVDNVRELCENVRYRPTKGAYKVYIIDEVHMLSQAAFNALLKTLEEPPSHVKFIFATTEPHKIPATILSRCQRFDFRRVSAEVLTTHLKSILKKEKVKVPDKALGLIVREAEGSVRDALSLLDQVLSFADGKITMDSVEGALGLLEHQLIVDLVQAVLDKDADKLLEIIAHIDARGHDLSSVAHLVLAHLRDLMVMTLTSKPDMRVLDRSDSELKVLKKQAGQTSSEDLQRYFHVATKAADDVQRSEHPKLSLEMGLLSLLAIVPTTSVEVLLKKLEEVGGAGGTLSVSAKPAFKGKKTNAPSAPKAVLDKTKVLEERVTTANMAEAPVSWVRFVDRVRAKRPALASFLEHGRPIDFSPTGVKLSISKKTFYWDALHERDNIDLIQNLLKEHFDQEVSWQIVDDGESPKAVQTMAESASAAKKDKRQKVIDDAHAHPGVQNVMEILGGEVQEIRPLDPDLD
ncbi:MAG: DNA polymerase III subunit gamma/tau [Myxococcota bacterium]|nr:DNA polymerase III subunit gamma/tau [Myxococcota bacterium]